MDAFLTGVVAGYGIAIPVGAIAVLIMDLGIRRGFIVAFFAGAGAATADFLYASLAVVGGAALAGVVESVDAQLRVVSGVVLIAIAVVGLWRARRGPDQGATLPTNGSDLARTYARFLALTIINPTTIVYFAAVIIGLGVADGMTAGDGALFAIGAFLASLSWQTLIAGGSALAGHRLSARARTIASISGNLVILVFGVLILVR